MCLKHFCDAYAAAKVASFNITFDKVCGNVTQQSTSKPLAFTCISFTHFKGSAVKCKRDIHN